MPDLPESEIIRLPERFSITITGNQFDWCSNNYPQPEMWHMLGRLFRGEEAALSTFRRWNMTVEVKEAPDARPK